ncbi:MAG TPA: NAD(P)H-hydrate dehydratase [Candidatus Kryptonia bacterium]|nr:NAD(P)H-hydrate dehydratase [Candidatus Kryptonia bacterium]
MIVVSAAEMRRLDQLTIDHGTPGHVLMERAGQGASAALLRWFPHARQRAVVICAGKGNNGGDGFVMARSLRRKGVRTRVALLGSESEVTGDALRNLRAFRKGRGVIDEIRGVDDLTALSTRLDGAALIVDALFGTGLNAPIRGIAADVIELINSCGVPVCSVDIPSGLDADRGVPLGTAVQAEATTTFGFAKIGHLIYPGVDYTGALAVVDIGIDEAAVDIVSPATRLIERSTVAGLVPRRRPDAHKGDSGHLLIIAGSRGRTGAAQLAARSALRCGAGLVTLAGPATLNPIFCAAAPEVMTAALPDRDDQLLFDASQLARLLDGKSAVVVGPGMGTHGDAHRTVLWLLEHAEVPIVADADALTCLSTTSSWPEVRGGLIVTPHPGEMARLDRSDTNAVQGDRVGVARRFAAEHDCVVILKGARSVIADAEGAVWINPTGNPGMAVGGMGDVLSGVAGALLAQGLDPEDAAQLAAFVHGAAADAIVRARGSELGLLASEVADELPRALGRLAATA